MDRHQVEPPENRLGEQRADRETQLSGDEPEHGGRPLQDTRIYKLYDRTMRPLVESPRKAVVALVVSLFAPAAALAAVTPEQIQRVVRMYLVADEMLLVTTP